MNSSHKELIGREAVEFRKKRIELLFTVIKGNRGWKADFIKKFSHFDSLKGAEIITSGMAGRTDDPDLLKALEEFIPWVQESQPSWYKKQKKIDDN